MAEYKFTAALNADTFPLVTRFQGREVIISGLDNRLRKSSSSNKEGETDNNPQNLPQVLYAENVMPTEDGVMSVGYEVAQAAAAPPVTVFDEIAMLRDASTNWWYFSPANGNNFVVSSSGGAWASVGSVAPNANIVHYAYVNGVSLVLYATSQLLEWNGGGFAFINRNGALVGLPVGNIRGICGAGNYLIAFTGVQVYWSSLTNMFDFADVINGAGTQIPTDVRGAIVAVTNVAGGFIIHCVHNAVAAIYTNNAAQPWTFREIKNAGGVISKKQIALDSTTGSVYIWGTNGLQKLNLREADTIFPAATDFLAGRVLETFDGGTNLLTVTRLAANLVVKLAFISGRYLVMSYGTVAPVYNYALVYDTELRRWGKLKFDHVDCFSIFNTPRQSIYFVVQTGAAYRLTMDYRALTDTGVLIMGKYQVSRTHRTCSEELVLELLDATDAVTVTVLTSYEGTNYDTQSLMLEYANSGAYRRFQKQVEGENLSYLIKGTFNLAGAMLVLTKGARM